MANQGSRLKRIEESRALRTTIKYLVLTIIAIFLLFRFGLPALSSLSAFVADFSGQEVNTGDQNKAPLPPPSINNLPNFTKEETIRVTGNTRPGHSVYIFFNNDKTEVLANASGEFTSSFKLSRGENTIYATVVDSSGRQSAKTPTFTAVYDNEPPKLDIIAPEQGKQFTGRDNHTQIEGETDADARVSVNDRVAIVRSDGKFNFPVTLTEGENTFKIISVDRAGNESEFELKLVYTP